MRVIETEAEGWRPSAEHGHRTARKIPAVEGRIAWPGPQNARDFAFLASRTQRTAKITLARSGLHSLPRRPRAYQPRRSIPTWTRSGRTSSRRTGRSCARSPSVGCRYVQIDETSLVKLGDPRAQQLLADARRRLARSVADLRRRPQRGRSRSARRDDVRDPRLPQPRSALASGHELRADRAGALQPAGDRCVSARVERPAGGPFEPLRHLPPGKRVVLGLVTATSTEVESADELKRRIEEASRYAPLDQLAARSRTAASPPPSARSTREPTSGNAAS